MRHWLMILASNDSNHDYDFDTDMKPRALALAFETDGFVPQGMIDRVFRTRDRVVRQLEDVDGRFWRPAMLV